MAQFAIDKTDLRILHVVQAEGRLTNVELSERVSLSPSPCLRRLKQLESEGYIRGYAALLSPQALKLGLQAFIRVSIDKSVAAREDFAQAVGLWPQVLSCFALTGETDYLLHAFFPDMTAFSHFVLDVLLSHPGVRDAKSSFVLDELKNTTALPLEHLYADMEAEAETEARQA
jgi:leucine-responsive regulatory protein